MDGRRVTAIESHGKHLFVELSRRAADDDGLVLQSHLGMHGAWRGYRPGESWRQGRAAGRAGLVAPARAAVVLETRARVYVCFGPREVAVLAAPDAEAFRRARHLGPDVTRAAPVPEVLLPRIARFVAAEAPLVDLLLDQRVTRGIGNVYASELLFDRRMHPLEPVASLDPEALGGLYRRAHDLLAANLVGGPRVVRSERDGRGSPVFHGRDGRPCCTCPRSLETARLA